MSVLLGDGGVGVGAGALWALNVYCFWILFPALTITETVLCQQTAFNTVQATMQLPGKLSQLCIWQWNCHSSAPGSETVTALVLCTGPWKGVRERGGSESLLTSFADDFGRVNSVVCTARHKSSPENFTKTTLLSKQIFWPDQADACFSWIATRKKCCFTSTETVGLLGSPGRPPQLSHSSWALNSITITFLYVWFTLVDSTGRLVAAMNLAIQYSSPLVPYSLLCSVEVAHIHQSPLSHWWFQKEIVLPPPVFYFGPLQEIWVTLPR